MHAVDAAESSSTALFVFSCALTDLLLGRITIAETFEQAKASGKAAFITFTACGYKEKADTVEILLALERGGANIIEVHDAMDCFVCAELLADNAFWMCCNSSAFLTRSRRPMARRSSARIRLV